MHRLGFWTQSLWVDTRQEYGLSESEALIFIWLSDELFAVNMKHYPPSSGIPRGESYRAMKRHSAVWNWCSVDELSECFAAGW